MDLHLSRKELLELQYVIGLGTEVWGGPERHGKRPMHETTPQVLRYVKLGLLDHLPGRGYFPTDLARRAVGVRVANQK